MTATEPETIVVTDTSPRCVIEHAIVQLRAKQDRMPSHWEQRRTDLAGEIDRLVDRWLKASA